MPTIAENKDLFDSSYDWSRGGEEWSQWWGMAQAQWAGSLYPRVFPFLKGRILAAAIRRISELARLAGRRPAEQSIERSK
jgi:hypothetical protein